MSKFKFLPILAGAAAAGLTFATIPQARADLVYEITSCHIDGGNCNGVSDFGQVTLHTITTGQVQVTAQLNDSNQFIATGMNPDVIDFNLTSPGTAFPAITESNFNSTNFTSGFTAAGTTPPSHADGTGDFQYTVNCNTSTQTCNGGSDELGSELQFTVTAAGITESSFAANANGQFFAMDIICPNCVPGANTGYVDASVLVPAPIIGHGLLVLLAVGGVLSGSKLLESLKKRHLHAA